MTGSSSPIRLRWALFGASAIVAVAVMVRFNTDAYAVPSSSMAPTLLTGDHILCTRVPAEGPKRGDVIVFYEPGRQTTMIKRVIGLPGDSVDVGLGGVLVNGSPISEDYLTSVHGDDRVSQIHVVPKGHFFLLGDNRSRSEDSRAFGFVSRESMLGKARLVYWSVQPGAADRGADVRWKRILLRVDTPRSY